MLVCGYHIDPEWSVDKIKYHDCEKESLPSNNTNKNSKNSETHSSHIHFHLAVTLSSYTVSAYINVVSDRVIPMNDICPEGITFEIEHPPQLS